MGIHIIWRGSFEAHPFRSVFTPQHCSGLAGNLTDRWASSGHFPIFSTIWLLTNSQKGGIVYAPKDENEIFSPLGSFHKGATLPLHQKPSPSLTINSKKSICTKKEEVFVEELRRHRRNTKKKTQIGDEC